MSLSVEGAGHMPRRCAATNTVYGNVNELLLTDDFRFYERNAGHTVSLIISRITQKRCTAKLKSTSLDNSRPDGLPSTYQPDLGNQFAADSTQQHIDGHRPQLSDIPQTALRSLYYGVNE